jgi:hypothetical protein
MTDRELLAGAYRDLLQATAILHRSRIFRHKGIVRLHLLVQSANCKILSVERAMAGAPKPKDGD